MPHISQVYTYPLKSCAANTHNKIEVRPEGLMHDRQLALIDDTGRLLTGRTEPQLTKFHCRIERGHLYVHDHVFELNTIGQKRVQHFDVSFSAQLASAEASTWFSEQLEKEVTLVINDMAKPRMIKEKYSIDSPLHMSDAGPILLVNQQSIDLLNSKLRNKVDALQFRPNIVVEDLKPNQELEWDRVYIKGIEFKKMSVCKRCNFINLNYDTLSYSKEPLATLSTYSTQENHVVFGIYLVPLNGGSIAVGDPILNIQEHSQ